MLAPSMVQQACKVMGAYVGRLDKRTPLKRFVRLAEDMLWALIGLSPSRRDADGDASQSWRHIASALEDSATKVSTESAVLQSIRA